MRPLLIIFLLSAGALLGVASGLSSAETLAISFFGSEARGWGFSSNIPGIPGPTIAIFAGDRLSIGLFSTDEESHNFGVDYDGNARPNEGEPVSRNFSTSIVYELNATASPGSYTYYCYFHPDTMFGTMNIVEGGLTTVEVSPNETEVRVGDSFPVVLRASNVRDVYGYRAGVKFDPGTLEVRNVNLMGTWMDVEERPFAPSVINVDNADGQVWVEVWIQGTLPGVTGSGVLVSLDFVALSSGRSAVELDQSDTILWDSQMRPMTRALTDGSVSVLASRQIDLWTLQSTVRPAGDGAVTVSGVVRNTGALPVYVAIQLRLAWSRTGKVSSGVAGPVFLSPGQEHEWSAALPVPSVTDRIRVESSLLFSGHLLPAGDSGWLATDTNFVSFRTLADT